MPLIQWILDLLSTRRRTRPIVQVDADVRTFQVQAEVRAFTIDPDGRTFLIPANWSTEGCGEDRR